MNSMNIYLDNEEKQVLNTIYVNGKKYILCNNMEEIFFDDYDIYRIEENNVFEITDIDELRAVYNAFLNTVPNLSNNLKNKLLQDFENEAIQ